MPRKSKLDPFVDKIGIFPDKTIAEMAGTSAENVRVYRKRKDIPARWRGQGEPLPNEEAILALLAGTDQAATIEPAALVEPTPVAEIAPVFEDLPPEADDVEVSEPDLVAEPAVAFKGYEINVLGPNGNTKFVATGTDIVDAARNAVTALAARAIEGEVVEVKFLAGVLGL